MKTRVVRTHNPHDLCIQINRISDRLAERGGAALRLIGERIEKARRPTDKPRGSADHGLIFICSAKQEHKKPSLIPKQKGSDLLETAFPDSATGMTMAAVVIGLAMTEGYSAADQNVIANLLFAAAQAISTRASLLPADGGDPSPR